MWLFRSRQLTFLRVDALCQALAHKTEAFEPECIVSIDTGGRYVGEKLSKTLDIPHLNIYICRNIYDVPLLKKLPSIFGLAVRWILFRFTTPVVQRRLSMSDQLLIKDKRVLLVDDAISSGTTLQVGLQELQCAAIKTAVLVNICGRDVDYSQLNGVHYFPWSRTSPEYKKYLRYLEEART